jgi:hypothetical protein
MELPRVLSTGIYLHHFCTQLLITILTYIKFFSFFRRVGFLQGNQLIVTKSGLSVVLNMTITALILLYLIKCKRIINLNFHFNLKKLCFQFEMRLLQA